MTQILYLYCRENINKYFIKVLSEEISWLGRALNFKDICSMRSQVQTLQHWRCIASQVNVVGSEEKNTYKCRNPGLRFLLVQFIFQSITCWNEGEYRKLPKAFWGLTVVVRVGCLKCPEVSWCFMMWTLYKVLKTPVFQLWYSFFQLTRSIERFKLTPFRICEVSHIAFIIWEWSPRAPWALGEQNPIMKMGIIKTFSVFLPYFQEKHWRLQCVFHLL